MEKDIIKAGFSSIEDFFLKVVLPTTVLTLIAFFAFMLYVPLPIYFSYVVLIFGFSFVLIIPYMMIERNKIEINENIHLFITYAGTISTIDLDRKKFFEQLSHSDQYGLISRISEKILYFAKRWNLGFARTCRKIAKSSPSRIFGDFLDRFAAALDFGEPMDVFMKDEQHAVLDDYETMYNESLNNIGMMREAFIAITISLAFGMSTALLMPLLMGISIIVAVKWSLFATFFIDVLLFIFAAAFIPSDDLLHDMKLKDKGMIRIYRSLFWTVPLSLFIMFVLFWFGWLSFLFNVAIGLTPMLYTGYLANQHENQLFKRDKEFPAFIRALGATIFARQGGVLSSLEALQVHDFGSLQEIVNNLYTRLKIQSDKLKSWKYFAAESGSKLISKFSLIFSESIYLGGHARQIGEMISSNFQRLIALRKLRYQQASALRGALYGSMVGFIVTVFISVSITEMLTQMFRASWEENVQQGGVSSMIASIIPPMPDLDPAALGLYLGITIVMHAFMSALVVKVVDGGNRYGMLFDFIAMVWIGAAMSWGVPLIADNLFAGSMGLA